MCIVMGAGTALNSQPAASPGRRQTVKKLKKNAKNRIYDNLSPTGVLINLKRA